MDARPWIVAGALVSLSACNALRKTQECSVNLDCPRGTACDVDHGFCRTGGPITIGFLGGRTGNDKDVTEERRIGLEFGRWIVERDPSQKVLGRGIAFHIEDTLSQVTEVPGATTRILNQNLAALIGPARSAEVLESQKQTFPRQMLHLAPSGSAPSLGTAQPQDLHQRFLFQMVGTLPDYLPMIPLFLSLPAGPDRPASYDTCFDGVAIATSDDVFGTAIQETLQAPGRNLLVRNCLTATLFLTIPTSKQSYDDEAAALLAPTVQRDGKPTRCLFLALQTDVAGELLRALKAREATTSRPPYSAFIGSSTLNAPNFYDQLQSPVAGEPSLAEGFSGFDADANPKRTQLRDLLQLWDDYLNATQVYKPGTPIGSNRGNFVEAAIALSLAIEMAGTVEDPVALRDAFVDVTTYTAGDQIIGPKEIPAAFALIRRAREEGRRAAIDYRASYTNLDFGPDGFVHTGAVVWRAQGGVITTTKQYSEEDVATAATADPGPSCPHP